MDRNTSAVHRVAGELVARIADGSWRAGERIPGEHALARRFGVSRPTVREAIGMLSARGLLHVRPRSGTYVAGEISSGEMKALTDLISVDPGRIWELLEIRRIVDTAAAELAAARRSEEDLQRLQELARSPGLRSPRELIEQPEGGRAYGRFFALLARATGNGLFEHLVCSVAASLRRALPYSRLLLAEVEGAASTIRTQLLDILDAVERGDSEDARSRTAEHLDTLEAYLRRRSGR